MMHAGSDMVIWQPGSTAGTEKLRSASGDTPLSSQPALAALSPIRKTETMPFLLMILGVLSAAAFWWWRLKMIRDAGNDAADALGRIRGAYKMRQFRKKVEGSVLGTVDDPALAAAVLFYAIAKEDAVSAQRAPAVIRTHTTDMVPAERVDELVAYAEWASRDVVDPRDIVRRFKPLWRERLTPAERGDLIRMAEDIADLSPASVTSHTRTLDALREALSN